MIQRMFTEINEQKKTITVLSSQLKSIQSSIQKIDEPTMRKDISSPSVPICYDISQDSSLQSSSLSSDSFLQSSSFPSDRDLSSFYYSLNTTSLYSQTAKQLSGETPSFYSSLKSSEIDFPNSHLNYQESDDSLDTPVKRRKL